MRILGASACGGAVFAVREPAPARRNMHVGSILCGLALLHATEGQNLTQSLLNTTSIVRFGYLAQSYYPFYVWPAVTGTRLRPTGFVPRVVEEVAQRVGFLAEHVPILVSNAAAPLPQMVGKLTSREVDVLLSSVTPNLLSVPGIIVSLPISADRLRMLVRVTGTEASLTNWLMPFQSGMWLAILVAVACFAISLGLIVVLSSKAGDDSPWLGSGWLGLFPTLLYHIFAAILGGDEYNFSTPPMKLIRLAVLFFSFMVGAT